MDLSGASNCSTINECASGNDAANILNDNLASQTFSNAIKIKEEQDISDEQVKYYMKREMSDFSSDLHHDAAMDHLQDELENTLTSELILVKCEELNKWEDLQDTDSYICNENTRERCDRPSSSAQVKSKANVTNIDGLQNGLDIKSELEYVSPGEAKDGLQDELISKSNLKCSDGEKNLDDAFSEGGQFCLDFSEGAEKKIPLRDSRKQRKKVCAHCQFATRSKCTLRNHMQVHLKSEHKIGRWAESSYACKICDRVFRYKRFMDVHTKMHENKEINTNGLFECEVCKKEFTKKCVYVYHKNVHLKVKPYKCVHCEKTYTSKIYSWEHFRRIHKDKLLSCNECGRSFVTKQDLITHVKVHFDVQVFNCDVCSKSFKTQYNLMKHGKVHTKAVPFACEVCGKTYKWKLQLLKHKVTHSQQHKFKCGHCNEIFESKILLFSHIKSHKPLFSCSICSRNFRLKCHLSYHMSLIHSDKRPFSCEKCGKSFKTKFTLKKHDDVHSTYFGDFKCELCSSIFKLKDTFLKHLKKVHPKGKGVVFKCLKCKKCFKTEESIKLHMPLHTNLQQYVIIA